MPYIKKAEYERLILAGYALSNIAYNFAQGDGPRQLEPGDKTVLDRCRKDWDKITDRLPKLGKKRG